MHIREHSKAKNNISKIATTCTEKRSTADVGCRTSNGGWLDCNDGYGGNDGQVEWHKTTIDLQLCDWTLSGGRQQQQQQKWKMKNEKSKIKLPDSAHADTNLIYTTATTKRTSKKTINCIQMWKCTCVRVCVRARVLSKAAARQSHCDGNSNTAWKAFGATA